MSRTKNNRKGEDPAVIAVRAFGGLNMWHRESRFSMIWGSQKARLLFCFLLVSYDQWIHRDKLIELLWPGCDVAGGINNFKTTLSRLRKSFCGANHLNPVLTQGEAIRINSAAITLDVSEFVDNATAGIKLYARGDLKAARVHLEKAQDLYTGDFLPEEPFNTFLTAARKDYADLNTSVITTLSKLYQQEGNVDALEAISFLMRSPDPVGTPA